jgi:hypothetical protein
VLSVSNPKLHAICQRLLVAIPPPYVPPPKPPKPPKVPKPRKPRTPKRVSTL